MSASDEEIMAEVEAALVGVTDEESFRAALRTLAPNVPEELEYEYFEPQGETP